MIRAQLLFYSHFMHIIIVKIWNICVIFQTLDLNRPFYEYFLISYFASCFICLPIEFFPLQIALIARLFRNVLAWAILITLHSFFRDSPITFRMIFIFKYNLKYPFQSLLYLIKHVLVFLLRFVCYFAFNLSQSIINAVFLDIF